MRTHELKLCRKFYDAIISGEKTFEFRKNDRGFAVGDTIILKPVTDDESRAYIPDLAPIQAEISYILDESIIGGLEKGYCVLALKPKMNLVEMQKEVYANKINKGFNITNVEREFCLLYEEMGEAYEAFRKKKDDLGSELADVAIYLLGLSEILGFSLQDEIENKMKINKNREYEEVNGTFIKKLNK